jgi:hypothetical protein
MKILRSILAFIASICIICAGDALAQTDININDTNLIRIGGSVTVAQDRVVETAHAIGGSVTIGPNARVLDTAIAVGGDVIVKTGARVDGDAISIGGKIVREPGAVIAGDRSTFANSPEDLRQRHGMMSGTYGRNGFFPWYFFHAMSRIATAIVAAIIGAIIIQTRPQFLPDLAAKLRHQSAATAGWGLAAIAAIFCANVFLAITLIGIPLIPLLALTAIVTALIGSLGVVVFIGQILDRTARLPVSNQFFLGLGVVTLLSLIPLVGGLVVFLLNLFGLGAILQWQFERSKPQMSAH